MKKLFKKAISSILAFAIAITAVAQLPLSEGIGLTGTAVTASAETTIPDGYTPVYTMQDLYNIRNNTSGKYIIMNDIDMSGTAKGGTWDSGKGWKTIPSFDGIIDGGGHRLMNMNMYGSVGNFGGFIGALSPSGIVKNIRFTNVNINITGSSGTFGTIAGCCYGAIENCCVTGNIKTYILSTGGICGCLYRSASTNIGYVSNCYNEATIRNSYGFDYTGGIVGYTNSSNNGNYPIISYCYNAGVINNDYFHGGIAGDTTANISNCVNYSYGRIAYKAKSVNSSYCLSGSSFGSYGTLLSSSEMQKQNNYTELSFSNIWYMCPEHNRPELKSLPEVYNLNVTGVSLLTLPDTLIYKQGDKISVDGAMLSVSADDGTTTKAYLSKDMLSGYDMSVVGKQTVTVTVDKHTTTFDIEVLPIEETGVTLSAEELTVYKGDTGTLKATVSPSNATYKTVTWTSSDETVATVSSTGVITGVENGTAIITATTSNGLTATCTVTICPPPAKSVTLNKTTATLYAGETVELSATMAPAETTDTITWRSNNTSVATVSENGVVTAKAKGTATITATTTSGKTATCKVTVIKCATAIKLSKTSLSLNKGKTAALTYTLTPTDSNDTVTWKSSNTKIATVSSTGVVKAIAKGTATITATTTSGKKATCKVTVKIPATSVKLSKTSLILNKGKTYTLKATMSPTTTTDKVTWKSSNTKIATVSSTGVVKAIAKGTATITATTTSGKKATCKVTVKVPATSVKLSKTSATVVKGKTLTLKATMSPTTTTDKVTWKSSNTKVATVSSTGVVKGIAKGTCTITATTTSGKKATCKITVKEIKAKGVKLSKTSATVAKGKTLTLKATLTPSNTTDKVTWKSSNTKVATVSSTGVVKGVKYGTCTITATINGKKATCKITVPKVKTTKITLNKTSATINNYSSTTLTAKINPTNSDEGCKWTVSDSSIATIKSNGKTCTVSGKKPGTVTVTAKSGTKSITCKVTVKKLVTTLYEDSSVKITFKSAEKYKYRDDQLELYFYVKNKTKKTLTIQADAVSLNGYSFCSTIMSDDVPAYSTGTVKLSVNNFDFSLLDINNIKTIGGQFRIVDDATWDSYDALFVNVKLDGTGTGGKPSGFKNSNLLYSDSTCSIYYWYAEKYKYDDNEIDLYFFVENKTSRTLLMQADAVSINGYSYSDVIMSDEVLPHTIGVIKLRVDDVDFNDININNITRMGGQFRVIDDITCKSYDAIFTNKRITK